MTEAIGTEWTDSYSGGGGFVEGVHWGRMDDPMQDGVRIRISSDGIREDVVKAGEVVASRQLSESEAAEKWNIHY